MVLFDSRESVSTTGHGLLAAGAVPDTDRVTTDGVTTAESATQILALCVAKDPLLVVVVDIPGVTGVLSNFETLKLLTERGTVSNTVLSGNTDLWRTS